MNLTNLFAGRSALGVLAIVSTACGAASGTSDPDELATQLAGQCAPAYAVKTYNGGDKVQNGGTVYQCKPFPFSGWCGLGGAYEPGVGFAWQDAWTSLGACTTGGTTTGGTTT